MHRAFDWHRDCTAIFPKSPETHMDRNLVSAQEHEIEYLARKHGTTVEKVKEIIAQTTSRSRREIEEALDQHFQHHSANEHAE